MKNKKPPDIYNNEKHFNPKSMELVFKKVEVRHIRSNSLR